MKPQSLNAVYSTPSMRRYEVWFLRLHLADSSGAGHEGQVYAFPRLRAIERDHENLRWTLHCSRREDASTLVAVLDGGGESAHRLSYLKTNCAGTLEVANNSFARAKLYFSRPSQPVTEIHTDGGAALEMVGD